MRRADGRGACRAAGAPGPAPDGGAAGPDGPPASRRAAGEAGSTGDGTSKRKREGGAGASPGKGKKSLWETAKSLSLFGKAPTAAAPDAPAVPSAKKRARTGGASAGATEVLVEQLECVICREVMVGAHALVPCGHAFCAECAHQWLAHKNACPTCRKKTTADPVPVLPLDALVKRLVVPGLEPAKQAAFAEREERWQARRAEMREKAAATRTAPPPPRGPDFMATFVTVAPPPDGDAGPPGSPGASLTGRILRTPVVIHGRLPVGGAGDGGEQPDAPDMPFPMPPGLASVLQALASAPGALPMGREGGAPPSLRELFRAGRPRAQARSGPRPGAEGPAPGGATAGQRAMRAARQERAAGQRAVRAARQRDSPRTPDDTSPAAQRQSSEDFLRRLTRLSGGRPRGTGPGGSGPPGDAQGAGHERRA